MMRKLLCLLAVTGMLVVSSSAMAQNAVLDPGNSTFALKIAGLPSIVVPSALNYGGLSVTLTNNGLSHDVAMTNGVFSTASNSPGTSLFTGVPFITNLTGTFNNSSGTFTANFSTTNNPVGGNLNASLGGTSLSGTLCPGGCIGGFAGLNGTIAVGLLSPQTPKAIINGTVVGGGGQTTETILSGLAFIGVTGAPWISGKGRITGINTNMVSLPTQGAATGNAFTLDPASTVEVKTFTVGGNFLTDYPSAAIATTSFVSVTGTNNLASAVNGGDVTLVTPMRIDLTTVIPGRILPGKASMTLSLIPAPEPGTLLLLVSGAAGLALIGRKRMR
jgi:hypothetical protein